MKNGKAALTIWFEKPWCFPVPWTKALNKMGDWLLPELRGLKKVRVPKKNAARCSPGSKEHMTWNLKKIIANSERWCGKFSTLGMRWGCLSKILRIHSYNYVRARPAAMTQRISFGTGIAEGSCVYAVLLSVFISRRLWNQDPWPYIAQTIALARKDAAHIATHARFYKGRAGGYGGIK